MPTARKMRQKWWGVVDEAIGDLGIAAMKCDRLRAENSGGGLVAVKTRLAAAELGNVIRQVALDLQRIEWEPAKERNDG